MGLYSIFVIFFLIGGIGISVINRKSKSIVDNRNRWVKYFVYLGLVFGQLFLIEINQYKYFAVIVAFIGLYEIIKVKNSNKIAFFALPIYVFISLFFILFFNEMEVKMQQLLFVIVITFDGYSQIVGQLFGKTKLFPKVSPNKTLEGLFGGVISTLFISLILSKILDIETLKTIIFGLMISIFSVAGDFLTSYYKRINAVKDYSKMIPQHGGILDRFDSLMMAGFGFFLLLKLDFYNPLMIIFTSYVLLFLLIFLTSEILYYTLKCKVEISRKFVHITSGITCLSFPFYINNHWIVLVLCAGFILMLFISKRFYLLKSINNIDRKSYGSLLFPVSVYLCFLSFQHFNNEFIYFYLPILVLSICDPLAALVGKKWTYGKYKVGNDYKTIMGSMAFFVSCLIILTLSLYFSLEQKSVLVMLFYCALISIMTTGTEAFSRKGFDNLTIPMSVMLGLILL